MICLPPHQSPGRPPRPWTTERIARLAFLVGQGWEAEVIARDQLVATTEGNVRRQVNRFGLSMRSARERRLPPEARARLDLAARSRGLTRERLIHRLAVVAGSDPTLIDNILDDDA